MNKGTARLFNNLKNMPGNAVANAGHTLGIAAKPVAKTTTREYMDLIGEIYFNPEALEQIGNTLNGRSDKKGPLSKVKREMVMKNPEVSALVRKMCIERAVSEETDRTWNSLFEGINISGTAIGNKTAERTEFLQLRDKAVSDVLRKRMTFKEFTTQFGKVMGASMIHSKHMMGEIDKVMKSMAQKPNWEEQRKKAAKKIDQPTISTIEKMNGSEEHLQQAESFIGFMRGVHSMDGLVSGPYTYKELARIVVSRESRECVEQMRRLQDERTRSESNVVYHPEKVTDDERRRIEEAKKRSEDQMKGVEKKYRTDLASGKVELLSDYATSISDFANDEREAKSIHSTTVLDVNNAIAGRMHVESLKARLDEAHRVQQTIEENYKAMAEIGKDAHVDLYTEEIFGEFDVVREAMGEKQNAGSNDEKDESTRDDDDAR